MDKAFSSKIIEDIRKYWLMRYGLEISEESAERYLFILSELYLAICEAEQDIKREKMS
jgi:hypothetical protein